MTKQLLSEIAAEAQAFVDWRRSVQLSTANQKGEPLASYAPFYRDDDGAFYILVSTLAMHTTNLDNGVASILVIDDEQNSKQIYARVRLCFQCHTQEISRKFGEYDDILEKLKEKHGIVVETLSGLSDFKLYKLSPQSGRYIKGFGQAYQVDARLTWAKPIDR